MSSPSVKHFKLLLWAFCHLLFSPACSGGVATDLVFLIDGSKSVRPENFELVKKFINQIVDSLDVSERNAHVGLVQYSSSVRQEFPLGRFSSKKDIKTAVRKMSYMEKGTMTGQALKYLVDNSFAISSGGRPGVPKVAIVFTDGRSQDYINDAAKKAKELGRLSKSKNGENYIETSLSLAQATEWLRAHRNKILDRFSSEILF